uniref:Mechanosensitive ion channel MscS domain-containing protein n=1 Tax=Odontella aurita TaxID=265563 RepID=A0A7S4J3C4_9STRA|mmetsp:Transcript_37035/g.110911  ORF Transcript_37035/g.110911 Transcript_37035/m.110911 type:complete len:392 (+) Transcript_37035:188-1363(+)
MAVKKHLAILGNLPSLSSLIITPGDIPRIREALEQYDVNASDFILLLFLGFGTVPLFEIVYSQWLKFSYKDHTPLRDTYAYLAIVHFGQAARIAIVVCLADLLSVVLSAVGFPLFAGRDVDLGLMTARVMYSIWFAHRLVVLKRYVLSRLVETKPDRLQVGKAKIINRFINAIIALLTVIFVVDILDANIGAGLGSLFAMGGMGTLVFSLASKDLAGHLVSGLALTASDKFYEGDQIRLGDGTSGFVVRMSWLHTIIRGSDEINTKIPNSTIANMRVANLSRMDKCQVKQVIYFQHADADKMTALCAAIKDKIVGSCPELITDGSRPFRVHWTNIASDRLELTVDCRFNIKPIGDKYMDNRMTVFQAIDAAVNKVGIVKAIPVVMHMTQAA